MLKYCGLALKGVRLIFDALSGNKHLYIKLRKIFAGSNLQFWTNVWSTLNKMIEIASNDNFNQNGAKIHIPKHDIWKH